MSRQAIPVRVGKKVFESQKAAAEYLQVPGWKVSYAAGKGNPLVNGKYVSAFINKRQCPVYCTTNKTKFNSVVEAAEYANADHWTMSRNMSGKNKTFVDSNGNEYVRLVPMQKRKK